MDSTVSMFCNINWEAEIDFNNVPTWTNPVGKVFYKLKYDIEMTCSGGSIDFAIYYNGKRQGSKSIAVDFKDSYSKANNALMEDF